MAGIVIVGAGECGTRAALAARQAGWEGEITLLGAEPGAPYERPPLSKPDADGAFVKEIVGRDMLADQGIAYRDGVTATALDTQAKTLTLSDGGTLGYDRLLLATGARPRPLPCEGGDKAHVFRTRSDAERLFDAARHGARAVIVGAGLIGLELAAELGRRGAHVTVVELAPRPLGRAVPATLADRLHARHVAEGVEFVFGASVAAVEDGAVRLADGRSLPADVTIAAIGIVPDTALAEAAGIPCDNGILVDETLATGAPDVWAAGDCASMPWPSGGRRRFETWKSAQDQGVAAGRAMAGQPAPFELHPWFWSDQHDLGLQVVGLPHDGEAVLRRKDDGAEILFYLADDGRLIAAAGLGTGNAVAKDIRVAGKLIEAGAAPDPAALADPDADLRKILKAAKA